MKRIEAIVRPNALRVILDHLKVIGYPGVTVHEAEGHGTQKGAREVERSQNVEGLLPKMVVSMVVEDDRVEKIVAEIVKAARKGEIGDGKIFISPILEVIRIRTGERGSQAIHSKH